MRRQALLLGLFVSLMVPLAATAASGETPAANAGTVPSPGPMELIAQGDRLLSGAGGTVDGVAAIASYEAAIGKGSTIAFLRLGDIYRRGVVVRPDPLKALAYYKQAADAGNRAGKLRVAEMTARGEGTTQDVEGGRALARALADAGDASAFFALGEMYSQGDAGPIDSTAAVAAYRDAAERGSSRALVRLGMIYRDGTLANKDPALALEYFTRAADAGSAAARFAIGKGYVLGQFGEAGSPAEGVQMLRQLDEAGLKDAVLVLSDSYFAGRGVDRDPKTAINVLDDAMAKGNVAAGRRLVALYRDGRSSAVRRDLARARNYLTEVSKRLDADTLAVEQILLGAAAAASPGDYESVRTDFSAVGEPSRPDLVRKLRATNPHVYVYLVQSHLKERGAYAGALNGRLNAGTVRAISRYCGKIGTRAACIHGPLSNEVVELFQPLL